MTVPGHRISTLNDAPVRGDGRYVLYWMVAFRRRRWNHALDRAVEHARTLGLPLVVFEPLRVGYPWANDRHHEFVLEGMRDNEAAFEGTPASYLAFVERTPGQGKGLLERLAVDAAVVVTDDYPCFFLPRMVAAAAQRLPVRLEAVDSNGLLPVRLSDKVHARAHGFRRFAQRHLARELHGAPKADALHGAMLASLEPNAFHELQGHWPIGLTDVDTASLPIDHRVSKSPLIGGASAARERLLAFVKNDLADYGEGRNHPDEDRASGLSPWLHFGHLSTYEVFYEIVNREEWTPKQLPEKPNGSRHGWWQLSPSTESFLDELITWRELGYSTSALDPQYDQYESLPGWAQATLADHASDARQLVSPAKLDAAETYDALWNAAQRQLVSEGRMHNYLRMLWGKKILEWSETPRIALEVMVDLNNKYALDGRDPNSYSGIFWTLGRYDRPWGPERPIFGKVRYMSSDNTLKKLRLKRYLTTWGDQRGLF